ncbi:1,3-beta-glucanosyltransferase [Mycena venus]|uniref:1,3-beta-glucanosyltransferase n=1 Tax=Mycena venus TaxID=2733690 RepID=A0A8H7CXW5_9AGAR|nr:1,3-beta-glucanosyltransferase [Mycena venus]
MRVTGRAFRAFLLGLIVSSVGAISPVTRTGRYLYASGSRFYIKGIAYQTTGTSTCALFQVLMPFPSADFGMPLVVDNLADTNGCSRDLPVLKKLGVNTIRSYTVDSTLNHDSCMRAFSEAGIYVIVDLALPPDGFIDQNAPSWNTDLLNQYIRTIDAFSKYDNVLAFNVGNEIILPNVTQAAPFIKAAARDIKAHLTSISSSVLVGYTSEDGVASFRDSIADYLSCDPSGRNNGSASIDIFGLSNYEWCGSGPATVYDALNSEFQNYNVVAYFSEFGSVSCLPRLWLETGTLFSSPMTNVWSGGVAFIYTGTPEYGLVTISLDGSTVTPSAEFANLAAQYAKVSFINSPSQSSAGASNFGACPASGTNFEASTALPQTPNDSACTCLANQLSCVFNPAANGSSALADTLTTQVCGLLEQTGANCNDIITNGTTGVYGSVGTLQSRNPSACNFNGNATVNAAITAAASAAASSCISNPSAVFTPTAPNVSAGPQTLSKKHHINVGAIAGGVVGGVVVTIIMALLGWWYVRRRRGFTLEVEPRLDLTDAEKPPFQPIPISTPRAGKPSAGNTDSDEFRPWEENEAITPPPSGSTAGHSPSPAPSEKSAKQPIIMRWDPPTSPPRSPLGAEEEIRQGASFPSSTSQPAAQSRERELEEEVLRLRQQVSALSPPAYSGENDIDDT